LSERSTTNVSRREKLLANEKRVCSTVPLETKKPGAMAGPACAALRGYHHLDSQHRLYARAPIAALEAHSFDRLHFDEQPDIPQLLWEHPPFGLS
jgi:hypothetical protein